MSNCSGMGGKDILDKDPRTDTYCYKNILQGHIYLWKYNLGLQYFWPFLIIYLHQRHVVFGSSVWKSMRIFPISPMNFSLGSISYLYVFLPYVHIPHVIIFFISSRFINNNSNNNKNCVYCGSTALVLNQDLILLALYKQRKKQYGSYQKRWCFRRKGITWR